jgi:REP element-mobilizing transposase RayT
MSSDSGSKSLRLQGYDYTQPGYYHTIIATQQGRRCFGSVVAEEMRLNTLGQIALESLLSLPDRFSNVELDHYVVMPNHVHALIFLKEPSVSPNTRVDQMPARFQSYWRALEREKLSPGAVPLYEVMRTFKAVTSYHAHRKGQVPSFAWHSGYYERIIAENERFLYNVRRYITNNPLKWELQRQEWEAAGFRWVRIPRQDAR